MLILQMRKLRHGEVNNLVQASLESKAAELAEVSTCVLTASIHLPPVLPVVGTRLQFVLQITGTQQWTRQSHSMLQKPGGVQVGRDERVGFFRGALWRSLVAVSRGGGLGLCRSRTAH